MCSLRAGHYEDYKYTSECVTAVVVLVCSLSHNLKCEVHVKICSVEQLNTHGEHEALR